MKKLLTALSIVVAACSLHAASLNWAINQVKTPSDSDVAGSGYMAYLFMTSQTVVSTTAENFGVANTTVAAATAALAAGTFADFASTYAAASKATTSAGLITGATGYYANFNAGDALSAFAIIIDAGSPADAKNYIVTSELSASWTSGTGTKTLNFGSQASASYTAVPEPTSGLLILLGMAGLALRRRRA